MTLGPLPGDDPRWGVVDLFAGLGGWTEGATQAGARVLWAANHWPAAVACHRDNHPGVVHLPGPPASRLGGRARARPAPRLALVYGPYPGPREGAAAPRRRTVDGLGDRVLRRGAPPARAGRRERRGVPPLGRFAQSSEFVAWGTAGPSADDAAVGCLPGHLLAAAPRGEEREHVTQKPIEAMTWLLRIVPAGGTVLDPFAGSGSTGCAAIATGRAFIGVESTEANAEIAARRLEQAEADGIQVPLVAPPVDEPGGVQVGLPLGAP